MTRDVGIGLVGIGVHGARYARHLLDGDVPGARLVAVCRRDADPGRAFASEHGVSFDDDPGALAARPAVDAVVVCARPDAHASIACAAIAAGKPVLVEKPLAATAEDARAVEHAVERAGVPAMVAQTLRFDAVVERVREIAGELGRIHAIAIEQHLEPRTRGWIDTPGPGGAMINTAVHGLDLWRHLSGAEIVAVSAEIARGATRHTEDLVAVTGRLEPGGIVATLLNTRVPRARSGRVEIVGERGIVVGDHVHREVVRVVDRRVVSREAVAPSPTLPATLRAFVEGLTTGRPFPVTTRDGRRVVEAARAALEAADSGRRVELP